MLFNDGKPIQVNYDDNTLKGSDLNNKLAECDAKTDAMMQEYNAFVNDLVALPKEEQEAKMPEYEEWFKKLGECYVAVVEENKDNLIPVAFIQNIRSLAGPDKFNEYVESDAKSPPPGRRKPRPRSRPSSARSSSTSKRPIRTATCTN